MSDDRNRQARRQPAQHAANLHKPISELKLYVCGGATLLNAAQRGSPEHLKRLAKEWPEDISYSKKALTIVFDHLEMQLELLPSQRSLQDCPPIDTIRTCLDALDGGFNSLPSRNSDHKEEFFMVLRPRLKVLFRCLRFLMRCSPILYDPPYKGRSQAAIRLTCILELGVQSTDDPDSLEQIVDFALDVWFDVATSRWDDDVAMSPAAYEDQYLIPYQPITRCITRDPSRTILFQKVDALDHKSLKALVNFFHHQCILWPTVYRKQYLQGPGSLDCSMFISYLAGMTMFCQKSDSFFKIIAKSQTLTLALGIAQEFRSGICRLRLTGRTASFPVEIAGRLFHSGILLADRTHRLVPQFIDHGLLDIIADSLLLALRTGSEPFDEWKPKPKSTTSTPLNRLYCLSPHPRVSKALIDAISSLPTSVKDTLSADTGATGKIWNDFTREMKYYQDALDILEVGAPAICDCLEHGFDSDAEQPRDALCQRADWETFHRSECANSRVRRVDQEIHQFHISYRSRVFKVLHLEQILNDVVQTIPLSNQEWDDDEGSKHRKHILLIDVTLLPVEINHLSAESAQTCEHMGIYLFNDNRCQAMIEQCEQDEDAFFAASISSQGRYGVVTYGMFLEHLMDTDSDERPLKKVTLTTSFMRVIDAVEGEWTCFNL
ncbi:hypothetical protein D9611_005857 [Ephemerocybe angulata]|uniref:Uncharacterized protein n=1 Tax=Ephemerocybe angulata TaxID=980116 RepID=A0A8H5FLV7_9AGAR|nr:hypothetical protein D9611_005857 [Tulosesus angulatus]